METLFAIGMLVGLMRPYAEPPKAAAPIEQHQSPQRAVEAERTRPRNKKSEWPLGY